MIDAREQLIAWSRVGALPAARLPEALRVAGVTPGREAWRAFVAHLLVWLGAVLLAAAATCFVAANWQALGRYGKFALVQTALVAVIGIAWWRGLDSLGGRVALFAAALVTGVLLALVGQVYQTGADTFELFALWALFIVPWALVGRQPALWVLVVALVDIAIVLYFRTNAARRLGTFDLVLAPRAALWCVIVFNAVALVAWEVAAAMRGGWLAVRWAPRVLAVSVGAALTFLAIQYVVGWWDRKAGIESLVAYGAFAAAMFWAYRVRAVDLFMLSGLVLSAIVLGAFALGRWVLPDGGMLAFLLIGIFIVGCAYASARWLRGLPDAVPEGEP